MRKIVFLLLSFSSVCCAYQPFELHKEPFKRVYFEGHHYIVTPAEPPYQCIIHCPSCSCDTEWNGFMQRFREDPNPPND